MRRKGCIIIILILCSSIIYSQPINDNCADAFALTVSSGECNPVTYSNFASTYSITDPIPSCWGPDAPDNNVWFTFSPSGNAVIINTNFDIEITNTQVAVYSGTCGAFSEIACQEDVDVSAGLTDVILLVDGLTSGTTYYIMVDGNFGETGDFEICVENITIPTAGPIQDCPVGLFLCDKDDIVVPDGTGGDGALEESPVCFGASGEISSDWYIFTTVNSGTFTFEVYPTSPTDFDWALYDITGSPSGTCELDEQIGCNGNNSTGVTGIGCAGAACASTVTLTAGHTYALIINRETAAFASGYTLSFGGTVLFDSPTAEIGDATICPGQEVEFENQSVGGSYYFWNFGEGSTSTSENPEITYDIPGTYTVTLVVTAIPGGCSSVTEATVIVSDGPELSIEPVDPVICPGESVVLDLTYILVDTCEPLMFEMDEGIEIPGGPAINIPLNVSGVSPSTFSPDILESVCINIEHETDSELDISLMCPDGTIIELSTDNGGTGNDYNGTCFVVSGAPAITTGSAPFGGIYTPEGDFSDFTGCTTNGTWTLIVDDDVTAGELGSVEYWSISFACENLPESILWTPATGLSSTTVEDPIASPMVTTTYTVTVTEFSGCSSSESVTVTVTDEIPDAGFSFPGAPFCSEGSDVAPLLDTDAISGTWSSEPPGLVIEAISGVIDLSASTPGVYTITNSVSTECGDAIATFTITVANDYYFVIDAFICEGESYVLPDGTVINVNGTYTSNLFTADGCDSIITTNLVVHTEYETTESVEICTGGSYVLPDGTTVTTAGTYASEFTSIYGCDSTIITNVTVSAAYTTSVNATICEGEIYALPDGTTATTGGTYTTTLIATTGCDSIITTNLIVQPEYETTESVEICTGGSYVLPDGTTVTTAGTFASEFTSIYGCDSTIITNVTVSAAYTISVIANICEGEIYTLPDGTTATTGGTYTTTLIATTGCDSIITTDLVVHTEYETTESVEICTGGSYVLPDGTTVTTAGTYASEFTSIYGCDSTIITNVSVSAAYTISVNANICEGEIYTLPDGTTTTTGGIYTTTLISTTGCDSIIVTNLSIVDFFETDIAISLCDGDNYILPDGTIVFTSGLYVTELTSAGGCDSIVNTIITVFPVYEIFSYVSFCDGDSYTLPDGTVVYSAGTYVSPFTSIAGCDSLITTIVEVNPVYDFSSDVSICAGETYILEDGTSVSLAGTYLVSYTTGYGCDSTYATNVSLWPEFNIIINAEICEGSSYVLPDGTEVTSSGTFITNLFSVSGCDSIITTNISMIDQIVSDINANICSGEAYVLPDGSEVDVAGTYSFIFISSAGCDSIVHIDLEVLPNPIITISGLDPVYCLEADEVIISGEPSGGIFAGQGINDNTFDPASAGAGGPYTITYTFTDINGCTAQQFVFVTVIENMVDAGPDQTIHLGDSTYIAVITSGAVIWSDEAGLSCYDCVNTFASPVQTTTYYIVSTDEFGCTATDNITIFVLDYQPDETVYAPNAFTPNGDGVNDYFFIYGVDIDYIESLIIYDRWGKEIYNKQNIPAGAENGGWDGTYYGTELNPAVFAWVAKIMLKGEVRILLYGNVTLLK